MESTTFLYGRDFTCGISEAAKGTDGTSVVRHFTDLSESAIIF